MSARKPEGYVLPLCEADRCWQCPGVSVDYDHCTCRCHETGGGDLSEEEIDALRRTTTENGDGPLV